MESRGDLRHRQICDAASRGSPRRGLGAADLPRPQGEADESGRAKASKRWFTSSEEVNQTVVLSWALDRKADKLYPSTEQIRNRAMEVLGEMSLKAGYVNDGGYVEPSRSVKFLYSDAKGKGETEICRFKSDDPLGQTRSGKAGNVYLTGRVIDGTKTADGNVDTITVEILANTSPEATFQQPIEVALADVERRRAIVRAKEALANAASQKGCSQVNQTLTLSLSTDLKADKLHPSSDQVRDIDGNVLGEVSLTTEYPRRQANFGFVGKNTCQMTAFRFDDPIGHVRSGRAENLDFSGEVLEITKDKEGSIQTITVKVTVKRP